MAEMTCKIEIDAIELAQRLENLFLNLVPMYKQSLGKGDLYAAGWNACVSEILTNLHVYAGKGVDDAS